MSFFYGFYWVPISLAQEWIDWWLKKLNGEEKERSITVQEILSD